MPFQQVHGQNLRVGRDGPAFTLFVEVLNGGEEHFLADIVDLQNCRFRGENHVVLAGIVVAQVGAQVPRRIVPRPVPHPRRRRRVGGVVPVCGRVGPDHAIGNVRVCSGVVFFVKERLSVYGHSFPPWI